jgi:lipopolysaccharide export system permease protein
MMTTIDRYLTNQSLRTITTVVGSLLALITLFALFEELGESHETYGLQEASWYVVQTMPRRLDEILVYGLFIGYLITLGRFAETNELTVCRVAGMSPMRLLIALSPSLLFWLAISVSISEFIAPASERSAEVDKLQAIHGENALSKRKTLWIRTGQLYMQVQAIDENGIIRGVTQYWLNDADELVEIIQAERGQFDDVAQQWNLLNGSQTELSTATARAESFHARTWDNPITPEVLESQAFLDANKMSIIDLDRQIDFARTQRLGTSQYELAFWSKILKPATYVGLTLLALGVVLGPLREVGMGVRLTVGIFAGLSFKYIQDLFAPAAIVFELPALIAILIPITAYWLVAIHLIRRNA